MSKSKVSKTNRQNETVKTDNNVKLIAFFLTQFHPIPENDEWWGKGFTEWTNVTKAQPKFEGHYQPHFPADLGYYDLRLRETRREQIKLAKSYGIDGFCYHYYWFSGKRLLEQPLDDMLADTESDMPYCLSWANENWTRRWDAAEHEILIAQKYEANDDVDFIKGLIPHFKDPRYIKVDGAPLLIVYRPQHLPDSKKSVRIWKQVCAKEGIPALHVVCALTHRNWDYESFGFDAGVEFPPHGINSPNLRNNLNINTGFKGHCVDFKDVAEEYLARNYSAKNNCYRSVFPSWDNTARRGDIATVVLNGVPENYEYWLQSAIRKTKSEFPNENRFVFINAWNEWAEGCHLEPDRQFGHSFLDATLRAKNDKGTYTSWLKVASRSSNKISKSSKRKNLIGNLVKAPISIVSKIKATFKKKLNKRISNFLLRKGYTKLKLYGELKEEYFNLIIATLSGTIFEDKALQIVGGGKFDSKAREHGLDWPSNAVTMIGVKRLKNIRFTIENALSNGIRGDFVETGVWRGGGSIMAKAVFHANGVKNRLVVACDSFAGLPPPDIENYPQDTGSDFHVYEDLAVSLQTVKNNFEKFGLLDNKVRFIKGFFKDTMSKVPSQEIAVLRLDGDMYESTIQVLEGLFDRVTPGGWIIVDDYCVVEAARKACHDFLDHRGLQVVWREIDGVGKFFKKGEVPE